MTDTIAGLIGSAFWGGLTYVILFFPLHAPLWAAVGFAITVYFICRAISNIQEK